PAYLYAFLLLDARRAEAAEAVLRDALRLQEPDAVTDIPYIDFYLGEALFRQNRFEEAIPFLERYTRSYRGSALIAQGYLYTGLAYEMTGDRDRAEAAYRRIRSDHDYDADEAAQRRAERLLERPLTETERTLPLGQNLYDGGRDREAITTLQPVLTSSRADDVHRAEAAYRRIRSDHDYDADEDAQRRAEQLLERPLTETERTLLLGQNLYDGGRDREAITTLQPVLTSSSVEDVQRAEAAYRSGRAYQ